MGVDAIENNNTKKRARDDSRELDVHSPESKRVNTVMDPDPNPSELDRVDTETKTESPESNKTQHDSDDNSNELESPEVMKLRKDILDILDEAVEVPEIQDLDSVIRSLEEEIIRPVAEQTWDSGESQPDLGYLLEASDDELGLPPTVSQAQTHNEAINISCGDEGAVNGLGNMVEFEDKLPNYDLFEFGFGEQVADGNNYDANGNEDFATVDGLFDYSDGSEFSDLAWRSESLPAL